MATFPDVSPDYGASESVPAQMCELHSLALVILSAQRLA